LKRMVTVVDKMVYLDEQQTGQQQANPKRFEPISRSEWKRNDDFEPLWEFDEALSDDLNTAKCLPLIEKMLAARYVNEKLRWHIVATMDQVLGLGLLALERADLRIRPVSATITKDEIEAALARRTEARAAKDFATSDAIRDELASAGVEVMDGDPLGWEWKL
jgi:cysteinyl-tRNA synthetase